jgi:hypothetical protein
MQPNGQVSTTWLINKAFRSLNPIKTVKVSNESENSKIIEEIRQAIIELESIRKSFEFAQESDLIDYVIYSEKAAITKLSYLLKKAKSMKDVINY